MRISQRKKGWMHQTRELWRRWNMKQAARRLPAVYPEGAVFGDLWGVCVLFVCLTL